MRPPVVAGRLGLCPGSPCYERGTLIAWPGSIRTRTVSWKRVKLKLQVGSCSAALTKIATGVFSLRRSRVDLVGQSRPSSALSQDSSCL